MEEKDVLKKAIMQWGKELQLVMCIEEMSELTKAIVKELRGKRDIDNIKEEIVDVEIMMDQLKLIYIDEADFKKMKAKKIKRLDLIIRRD
ncbi:MAG: hypothetical protein U9N86_10350 [Bacteroidota bacterium]|nr:hypothetical protein [Bacteroidota bacterium]